MWRVVARAFVAAKPKRPPKKPIVIDPADVSEQFIRSRGPGGQSVNKRSSAVRLVHNPTGISLKMDEQRSQVANRSLAWALLKDKLDVLENGADSRLAKRAERAKRRKSKRRRRSLAKYRAEEAEPEEKT